MFQACGTFRFEGNRWVYDEEAHKKEIDKMVNKIVQIYTHLKRFLPQFPSYNPYIGKPAIDESHLWGISVILEDNYIRREAIYEKAALKLNIDRHSDAFDWIVKHIKIASLYDIERFALTGRSLIEGLRAQIENGQTYDFSFSEYGSTNNRQSSNKEDLVVIVAGYTSPMNDFF